MCGGAFSLPLATAGRDCGGRGKQRAIEDCRCRDGGFFTHFVVGVTPMRDSSSSSSENNVGRDRSRTKGS